MPGQKRLGSNKVVDFLRPVVEDGLQAVLLFGVISKLPKVLFWAAKLLKLFMSCNS